MSSNIVFAPHLSAPPPPCSDVADPTSSFSSRARGEEGEGLHLFDTTTLIDGRSRGWDEEALMWESLRCKVRKEEEGEKSHNNGLWGFGIRWHRANITDSASASLVEQLHPENNTVQVPEETSVPNPIESVSPNTNSPMAEDQTWNKRQIGYIFDLTTALGLMFLVRPLLPTNYDRWMMAAFAAIWGLGSIGLPFGLFGTSRLEKNWSRHVGRFISICFSLFVIYSIWILMLYVDGIPTPATSSLSPRADDQVPSDDNDSWKLVFASIGAFVLLGHLISWIRGCKTGGDRHRALRLICSMFCKGYIPFVCASLVGTSALEEHTYM